MKFLVFATEAKARSRNREMMDTKRKPGNPDGDGKPYVTTERHGVEVAEDGEAVLVVLDETGLTLSEKSALVNVRPVKFELPVDTIAGDTAGIATLRLLE